MDNVWIRRVECYTLCEATTAIKVNVEKLRNCEPAYRGETEKELLDYLINNVFENNEWADNETNIKVYGKNEAYDLIHEDCDAEVISDSRTKWGDIMYQLGEPDESFNPERFEIREESS